MDRLRYHHHHHRHLTRPFRSPLTLKLWIFCFVLSAQFFSRERTLWVLSSHKTSIINLSSIPCSCSGHLYKCSFYGMVGGCTHICQANQKASTCNVLFLVSFNMPCIAQDLHMLLREYDV